MQICSLRPEDAERVHELLVACHDRAELPIGPLWTVEQIRDEILTGGGVGSRHDGGGLCAFILFRQMGEVWEISHLATSPEIRRRGAMAGLLAHLRGLLPVGGQIWLEVHGRNDPARRLYEKLGFQIVGKRPKYYSDGGEAILYTLG